MSEQADDADDILNEAEASIFALSEKRIGQGFQRISETIRDSGGIDAFMQRGLSGSRAWRRISPNWTN